MILEELEDDFIRDINVYYREHLPSDSEPLHAVFVQGCREMAEYQAEHPDTPISSILFQFSMTDYYFGRSVMKIGFHTLDSTVDTPVVLCDGEADFLTAPLAEYEDRLHKIAERDHKSKEWVEQQKREMVKQMSFFANYHLKYQIRGWCEEGILDALELGERFFVCCGQYTQWMIPVYGLSFVNDLEIAEKEGKGKFCRYENLTYRGREFEELDLSGSVFDNCKFVSCAFRNCHFEDVDFKSCQFRRVVFEDSSMVGTLFQGCHFRKVELRNVEFEQTEHYTGLYRSFDMVDCEEDEDGIFSVNTQ